MRIARLLPLLLAIALPAASAAAQQMAPRPAPSADELARIQQRLGEIQQQAARSPEVVAGMEAFERRLREAMARLDPAAPGREARAEALKQEVEVARAASDNAKLNQLAAEAQELQRYFAELRGRAMELAEVQEARRSHLTILLARMKLIDPQTEALVARLQELRGGGGR